MEGCFPRLSVCQKIQLPFTAAIKLSAELGGREGMALSMWIVQTAGKGLMRVMQPFVLLPRITTHVASFVSCVCWCQGGLGFLSVFFFFFRSVVKIKLML